MHLSWKNLQGTQFIVNLAKQLFKMPSFFVKITNNVVASMALKEVNPVTNMNTYKDADDVLSQLNWTLEFIQFKPLAFNLNFYTH